MLTIKNGQISLYCYFNRIIRVPRTNFQSPALRQKHARNVSFTTYQYLTKFLFESAWIQQKQAYVEIPLLAIPLMAPQTLESVDFTNTQKYRYLENKT